MCFQFRDIIEAACASDWPSISQGVLAARCDRVRHTCTSQEEGKVTSATSVLGSHRKYCQYTSVKRASAERTMQRSKGTLPVGRGGDGQSWPWEGGHHPSLLTAGFLLLLVIKPPEYFAFRPPHPHRACHIKNDFNLFSITLGVCSWACVNILWRQEWALSPTCGGRRTTLWIWVSLYRYVGFWELNTAVWLAGQALLPAEPSLPSYTAGT